MKPFQKLMSDLIFAGSRHVREVFEKLRSVFAALDWIQKANTGISSVVSHKFGAALRNAGLEPAPPTTNLEKVKTNSRLAIFENTCPEWLMASLGAFSQSITVTTIYATLGMDAVEHAVNDNIISVIVCNKRNVANLVERKKNMPTLKTIVYTNDLVAATDKIDMPTAPKGMTIMSFDEFVASGDTAKFPPTPPKADTTAVM